MEVLEEYFNDNETQEYLKQMQSQIYMEEFTESELNQLATFYRTKIGQRYLQKFPIIEEKTWAMEMKIELPDKYKRAIDQKFKYLQEQGKLPEKIK